MSSRELKVLLIEDEENDYIWVRDMLSDIASVRFRLDWISTYEEAVAEICRFHHDVSLLDYRLGMRNGLELLREVMERGCNAPIILLTGQGGYGVDIEAMKAGAADYLVKNRINADQLERSIRYAIKGKQMEQGLLKEIAERHLAEDRLKKDLAALTRIHDLSRKMLEGRGIQPLLKEIMDAAVAIMHADFGTLQLLENNSLRIVAHYGFRQPFLDFFTSAKSAASICGETVKYSERVVVPDIEQSSIFAGTPSLAVLREAGVRAVQSTPLMGRTGALLGILTTQWSRPFFPDEHDLRRIDLLARQAADLIERARAERSLRESEERLYTILEQLPVGVAVIDTHGSFALTNSLADQWIPGKTIPSRDPKIVRRWHEFDTEGRSQPPEKWPSSNALRGEEVTGIEFQFMGNGQKLWILISSVPLKSSEGDILGGIVVMQDITRRKEMEEDLRESRDELKLRVQELDEKSLNLAEANVALKVMLKHKEDYQKELGETILSNVRNLVLPYLEKLKNTQMSSTQATLVEILESHFGEITSSFTRTLGIEAADLTPTEMRVAAFIRDGKSSAEIAEILRSSEKTVETHRLRIRKKLGLQSRRSNLRSHLLKLA